MPVQPPYWDEQRLDADRMLAIRQFRDKRVSESLDAYLASFAQFRAAIERLLNTTHDLTNLADQASSVLSDEEFLYAVRYLTGPPVSTDDLRILADAQVTPAALTSDPEAARRVVETR